MSGEAAAARAGAAVGDIAVDVAIVGGGPVGLLLGCLLALGGVNLVVLERRAVGTPRARAIGIHPPGLAVLDAAGVGDAVRAESVPIRRGRASTATRPLGELAFSTPIRSLPQERTEALLRARLTELAPGALRHGVDVVAVRDLGDAVELDLAGGGTVARAHYAVGADGVRSLVRGAIGADWRVRGGAGRYAMADLPTSDEPRETALIRLEAAGVVESFPLVGGGRRWVVRLDDGLDASTADAFAELVADRTGVRLDPQTIGTPSTFTAGQRIADRFAAGRIALVGDAAHEVSPIGGQGMSLGWLDALRLAAVLRDALAAGSPPRPFARYARVRRAAAVRSLRRARFNMAMGAPLTGLRSRGRTGLVRLLALPPLAGRLAAAFTMRRL